MKIDIKKALKTTTEATAGAVQLGAMLMLGVIVLGSIAYAVTGGNISIASAFNVVLTSLVTTTSGFFTTLGSTGTTIFALVVVVILFALFGSWVFGKQGKSRGSAY